ncbi:MAG: cytochrome c family protein [Candidatus Marinimicrobia bacterium]|nr:cytochrome c family protein [Candidatus Neomarinimicrobiota bacterium]
MFSILLLLAGATAFTQDSGILDEIPESIPLNVPKFIFHPVNFPHRAHSHISPQGVTCGNCHHFADEGVYDPCYECHSNDPADFSEDVPTLFAAYHRVCVSCHRQWNPQNVCGSCHLNPEQAVLDDQPTPALPPVKPTRGPDILHFDTPKSVNPMVTFRHKQHVETFRFSCVTCHENQDCLKCHAYKPPNVSPIVAKLTKPHVPCSKCHATDDQSNCTQCHKKQPTTRGFTHDMTGWLLNRFHQEQSCTACHDATKPVERLNPTCTNCHKNFEPGEFDHRRTGLDLYEVHQEADCGDCHLDRKFGEPPTCFYCHDEITYPDNLPGEWINK